MTLLLKWRDAVRARLIDDWHRFYKFSSVQLSLAGAAIAAFIEWFPNEAREVWEFIPADMRALLPTWLTSSLPIVMFLAIIIARVTRKKDKADG